MTDREFIQTLLNERNYYKKVAKAYKALRGKTLETCPESCKEGYLRRLKIIEEYENRGKSSIVNF